MLKTRLIPVLLLQNGYLVRSETFSDFQVIGHPVHEVRRFNQWNVDELIYLDISQQDGPYERRADYRYEGTDDSMSVLRTVSKTCFMPLTWGGRLRTVEDMRLCFANGADKITVNTQAFRTPGLITEASKLFGAQAVVVSIDAKRAENGGYEVMIDGGVTPAGAAPWDWAREAEKAGAGEILLQSVDRDGTAKGYDTELISKVAEAATVPVIACSGAGVFEHYPKAVQAGASAVAAANLWHFKELADRNGKRALRRAGIEVRL